MKQPFYHRATILFTSTEPFTLAELERLLQAALWSKGIRSIQVEEMEEPEPGDPADL